MILCLHILICVCVAVILATLFIIFAAEIRKNIKDKFLNAWCVLFIIASCVAIAACCTEAGIRDHEIYEVKGQAKEVTVVPGNNDDSHSKTLYYDEDEKVWFVLENKLTFVEFTVQKTVLSDAEVNQYLPLSTECVEKLFENHSRVVLR